jgi:hypothetical protein
MNEALDPNYRWRWRQQLAECARLLAADWPPPLPRINIGQGP